VLYRLFSWYSSVAGDVITQQAISGALKSKLPHESGKIALYETVYEGLQNTSASEADFKWALEQLQQEYATRETTKALTQAMRVLKAGMEGPDGEERIGHEAARDYILSKFSEVDLRLQVQEAPEGDTRQEEAEILDEYYATRDKTAGSEYLGLQFGIDEVDKYTGGLQPGELDFVLGYASSGKSSLCVQLAWWTAFQQKKNVVFVTTETLRPQIRRKLISRHSKLSKFEIPEGLNSSDLKRGNLDLELEDKLREVVFDYSHGDYGYLNVMQASDGMTLANTKLKLQRLQRERQIDLVIIDSIYILKADRNRPDSRQELNSIIESCKGLATTFNNGNGVPLVSPWQTSRIHKEKADKDRRYSMSAMAETAMAERYADIVIGLLEPEITQRYTTLSCNMVKNRDGEQSPSFEVKVDYATSHFSNQIRAADSSDFNGLIASFA
jgi:replicative DNA helicase